MEEKRKSEKPVDGMFALLFEDHFLSGKGGPRTRHTAGRTDGTDGMAWMRACVGMGSPVDVAV